MIFNDTDKNMGMVHADKEDVISECVRQLEGSRTYLELTEEMVKNIVPEVRNKLKRSWKAICIKAIVQKKRLIFFCLKCIYLIFNILYNLENPKKIQSLDE